MTSLRGSGTRRGWRRPAGISTSGPARRADWIDRTVQVLKISALTPEHWVAEFKRLKKVNEEIMRTRATKARGRARQS
jgi:hypothetical protein